VYYKDDWDRAKARFLAFWDREIVGRCCLAVAAYAIKPDIGLALDGGLTWGGHIPEHQNLCAMVQGMGIYLCSTSATLAQR
jgi:hypothetical protein